VCDLRALSELLGRTMDAGDLQLKPGTLDEISAALPRGGKRAADYEAEVFNFLHANREELGIAAVKRGKNVLVDGSVELQDGRRLALEIKLVMNWEKACQAQWQFTTFLARQGTLGPFHGGLVVFEDFSGAGWQKKAKKRPLQDGWYR
jgi:hypothetical protein